MAEMKELEAFDEKSTNPDDSGLSNQPTQEFAPIKTATAGPLSKQATGGSGRPGSGSGVSRVRSNNGYGCDEGDSDDGAPPDVESAARKDPFEVQWDGGESDPMNPRSMAYAKKWLIVIVVSASSFCV